MKKQKRSFDVIIIGGGVSGLACALELLELDKHMSVCILEARERLGGRIHSIRNNEFPRGVEMGAEFMHSDPQAFLSPFPFRKWSHKNMRYGTMKHKHCYRIGNIYNEIENFSDEVSRLWKQYHVTSETISLYEYLNNLKEVDSFVKNYFDTLVAFYEHYYCGDSKVLCAGSISDAEKQNTACEAHAISHVPTKENHELIKSFERECKKIGGTRFSVLTGHPAKDVIWNKGAVIVKTLSGEEYHSAQCILSIPLGVLKEALVDTGLNFQPSLPQKKIAAISNLDVGHAVKVTVKFMSSWWKWKESYMGKGELVNIVAPSKLFDNWWSHGLDNTPVLTAWATGKNAKNFLNMPKEQQSKLLEEEISEILPKSDKQHPEIETFEFHDWSSDPWAQGAYCAVPVGKQNYIADLACPVEKTLFFCGEATHHEGKHGTVHGAVETGLRAAIELMKTKDCV